MEKKTPLYQIHEKYGGKTVPFAGWLLPVQYGGIIAEHRAVREKCGIFDVSHMGEFLLTGEGALNTLNTLLTNDFRGMEDGGARYSPMCYENGGTVDDLIVYKIKENVYLIVVNAANTQKDFEWISAHMGGSAKIENISEKAAQIALQGPLSYDILSVIADAGDIPQKNYTAVINGSAAGVRCLISTTGYTGENGFELYCAPADAPALWEALMEAGKDKGLLPCGLGARDTLRLEAAMPLYGHELSADITPIEAGLKFFVKTEKEDFIGKGALAENPPRYRRIGLCVTGRGIAREHMDVYSADEKIGVVTSGTFCPHVNAAIALALVKPEYAQTKEELFVDIRGKKVTAKRVALPFYKKADK